VALLSFLSHRYFVHEEPCRVAFTINGRGEKRIEGVDSQVGDKDIVGVFQAAPGTFVKASSVSVYEAFA
jgi:hypothetical protein